MARVTYFNGNSTYTGQFEVRDYHGVGDYLAGNTTYSFLHSGGTGIDARRFAYRIELTFANLTLDPAEGENGAPIDLVTGGTVTRISYYNAAGAEILRFANLTLQAQFVIGSLEDGQSYSIFQAMTGGNDLITGSIRSGATVNDFNQDEIRSGWGDDTVRALAGNDYLRDGGGTDTYDGGNGRDTLTYDNWSDMPHLAQQGITWNAALGTVVGPDGKTDTLISIEEVRGTWMQDTFIGNGTAIAAIGMGGADRFEGSVGVRDMVLYAFELNNGGRGGVKVNLATGVARDSFGSTDTLVSIDDILGTSRADVLRDSATDNYFDGREGNDLLTLGAGNDWVKGGAGADQFTFVGRFGIDTVEDFNPNQGDHLTISGATGLSSLRLVDGPNGLEISTTRGTVVLLGHSALEVTADWFIF